MDGSQLVEPVPVADIFCSGVGAIEAVGADCLRFYLYVLQPLMPGNSPQERVIVAKVVVARGIVPEAVLYALNLAGVPMLGGQPEARPN